MTFLVLLWYNTFAEVILMKVQYTLLKKDEHTQGRYGKLKRIPRRRESDYNEKWQSGEKKKNQAEVGKLSV